jgi:RimJ/RimL family protein N-acetyltransferase
MTARPDLVAAWPLFGLRLRTERLEMRLPTEDETLDLMALAKRGIHPPDEMPFGVPWSTLPSPEFERGFLRYHWSNRANWQPGSWILDFITVLDGVIVGSQGLRANDFATTRTIGTGSWLGREYQGRGLGTEMRAAVLGFAFDGLGVRVAETCAFLDNARSNAVSHSLGYEESGLGSLAPEGVPRPTQEFRMTDTGWRSRQRPPLTIEGLEACREMFGI